MWEREGGKVALLKGKVLLWLKNVLYALTEPQMDLSYWQAKGISENRIVKQQKLISSKLKWIAKATAWKNDLFRRQGRRV